MTARCRAVDRANAFKFYEMYYTAIRFGRTRAELGTIPKRSRCIQTRESSFDWLSKRDGQKGSQYSVSIFLLATCSSSAARVVGTIVSYTFLLYGAFYSTVCPERAPTPYLHDFQPRRQTSKLASLLFPILT